MAFVTSVEIKCERSTNPEERKVLKTKWSSKTFLALTPVLNQDALRTQLQEFLQMPIKKVLVLFGKKWYLSAIMGTLPLHKVIIRG